MKYRIIKLQNPEPFPYVVQKDTGFFFTTWRDVQLFQTKGKAESYIKDKMDPEVVEIYE